MSSCSSTLVKNGMKPLVASLGCTVSSLSFDRKANYTEAVTKEKIKLEV